MKTLTLLIFLFGCISTHINTNGEYYTRYEYIISGNTPVYINRDSYIVLSDTLVLIEHENNGEFFQTEYKIVQRSCLTPYHCTYKTDGLIYFECIDRDLVVNKIDLNKDCNKEGSTMIYFFSGLKKVSPN